MNRQDLIDAIAEDTEASKAATTRFLDSLITIVQNEVAKGGAVLPGNEAVDVLYDGETFTEFRAPKLGERYISGAGCTRWTPSSR